MKQNIYIYLLVCATMATSVCAQSHSPLNEIPANVKICRSASPKVLKEMTFYNTDGTKRQKYSYEYKEKELLSSEIFQIWNKSSNDWRDHQKTVYNYNAENMPVEEIALYNSVGGWKNTSKKIPTYLEGKITEELSYSWDAETGEWQDASFKYTYTYNAEGFQSEYVQQIKKASADDWDTPSLKVTYTRNPAGNVTEELSQLWDEATNAWIDYDKYVYNYDADKDQMHAFYYKLKNGVWADGYKVICFYDKDGDLERADYYSSFDDSSLDVSCAYTYTNLSSGETGLTSIDAATVSIYPNPATTYIDIKIPSEFVNKLAYLYDAAGQLTKTIRLDNEITRISISGLHSGIYFVKIENRTSKFVKR